MAAAVRQQYNCRVQKTIRAFIAIHLPREVRAYLGQLTEDLAAQVPHRAVRWVKADRMHLTLRFLGDTGETLLPEIQQSLDEITVQYQPFNLHLEGFGCFPNKKRPRVLWAGIGGEVKTAARLKEAIDAGLEPLGWEVEKRPFRPHLTVGRVKVSHKVAAQRWPVEVQLLEIPVDSIQLIESELTPDGPIYTVRHSTRLQTG